MTRNVGRIRLGLAECAATTEAALRALSKVGTPAELAGLMEAVTAEIGFRHYALIHHDDLRGSPADRVKILDYPDSIEQRIISEATWRRDPVIRASLFAPRAFRWSEIGDIITLDGRDEDCLRMGAKAGLNEGITVPFHLLGECTGSCTFAGTRAPRRSRRYLGVAQMIGIFAFQAARRVIGASDTRAPRPRLQPRPRDCIVLIGRGLSNKEIARALGITPRTVDGYLTEARQLFDAHDRTELVISALFAGEIGLSELRPGQPEHSLGLRPG
jgi:DNA-binding CsgD family transcriptional regulator